MKISYRWLKEYIDITETPEKLGKMLTGSGLEVEHIVPFESIQGGMEGLVVGEVLSRVKHPHADRLFLTVIDVGDTEPFQIVCGAPNIAAGQKVIVAKPGTTLYPLQGTPYTIKKTKIRGEYSKGMVCSENEIGLKKTQEGIIVLNSNDKAVNGMPAAAYYRLEKDFIFEIGLTPNRGDATSHIGVAREIKALKKGTVIRKPSTDRFKVTNTTLTIPVTIESPEACLRYSAVTLSGVVIKDSPDWIQKRLRSIGLTPINNVVDATNYVCHELGQPLHAFDADHIVGNKVIVKTMPVGTSFTTLDGEKRTLASDDLMICNEDEGMCIAGVFGGLQAGITKETKNVLLESAYFSPEYIRNTSVRHQLKTDASFRFERGTDPTTTVYALKRAALLIQETAGGIVSSEIIDVYPKEVKGNEIEVKDKHVNRLIGKRIPRKKVFEILESLDMSIKEQKNNAYTVQSPPYRVGITQEADVIEEILRIYGFDHIELGEGVSTSYFAHFSKKDINRYKRTLGEGLAANGYYEIITNSITRTVYQKKYELGFSRQPIAILNTSNEEYGALRHSMLFTGLEVCMQNINRKQRDLKLFDFGKIYWKEGVEYKEKERLALYLTGRIESESWQHKPRKVSYFDLAQQMDYILEKSNLNHVVSQKQLEHDPLFEYGMAWFKDGHCLGTVGKIKTAITKDFDVKQEIFYADLDIALLFKAASFKLEVEEVPKYPQVRRDLSLILNKKVTFTEVKKIVSKTERKLVKDLVVFDAYEGKNIPEGKKAYALGIVLGDVSKTLEDKEIDRTMNKLIRALEQEVDAIIRK